MARDEVANILGKTEKSLFASNISEFLLSNLPTILSRRKDGDYLQLGAAFFWRTAC
jgi:hypothetical protein